MNVDERFWSKVGMGLCWEWQGHVNTTTGYGTFWVNGRTCIAHRVAWELMVGPIPAGYDIDHLCRNRRCVNPDHLEPVTRAENNRRKVQPRPYLTTHCSNGHPFEGDNLYVNPHGVRICRICRRATDRARHERDGDRRRAAHRAQYHQRQDEFAEGLGA